VSDGGAPRRVLVVYSKVGGGHLSAARALAAELDATGRAVAQIADIYVDCGSFPVNQFPAVYSWLARRHPVLWSLVFHGSNNRLDPKRVVGPFVRDGLRRLVERERPDVIVSVLPAVNGLLAEAAEQVGARLEVVLTDWHSVHRFWVAPGVDGYTVPTDSARLDCVRYGAAAECVEVVGIPVRRAFMPVEDVWGRRHSTLASMGLDPSRFTLLVMVGAEGSPRALRSVRRMAQLEIDAQMLVVCGRNAALCEQVDALPARLSLRAIGFVEQIADLMRSSDVLITKAGGLTLAEAFCCGVPVVVYDVLHGQESGNLRYVLNQNAVVVARSPRSLGKALLRLHTDSAQRADLAAAGRRLARPDAAARIAQNLLARLG
jgi:UDP-N-acetylglucosamine:LPS N-acetylglucosamine transferase